MGGRGASSGVSDSGKIYGTEYHTVLKSGNIKFVKMNSGNTKAPMETMTSGRVYVTVANGDKLKYISYYDAKNKKKKTIDLDHYHNGLKPHVHHGYEHNERDGKKGGTGLSQKEKNMVANVETIWKNRKRK